MSRRVVGTPVSENCPLVGISIADAVLVNGPNPSSSASGALGGVGGPAAKYAFSSHARMPWRARIATTKLFATLAVIAVALVCASLVMSSSSLRHGATDDDVQDQTPGGDGGLLGVDDSADEWGQVRLSRARILLARLVDTHASSRRSLQSSPDTPRTFDPLERTVHYHPGTSSSNQTRRRRAAIDPRAATLELTTPPASRHCLVFVQIIRFL